MPVAVLGQAFQGVTPSFHPLEYQFYVTFKELREAFKIPAETYYDWKKKAESGYYEEKKKFERKRLIDKAKLKQAVEEKPDSYLRELAEPFCCTEQAIFYALRKLGITYKKRRIPTRKSPKKNEKNF